MRGANPRLLHLCGTTVTGCNPARSRLPRAPQCERASAARQPDARLIRRRCADRFHAGGMAQRDEKIRKSGSAGRENPGQSNIRKSGSGKSGSEQHSAKIRKENPRRKIRVRATFGENPRRKSAKIRVRATLAKAKTRKSGSGKDEKIRVRATLAKAKVTLTRIFLLTDYCTGKSGSEQHSARKSGSEENPGQRKTRKSGSEQH